MDWNIHKYILNRNKNVPSYFFRYLFNIYIKGKILKSPFQFSFMHSFKTNGAFLPSLICQCQVVQDTRPAIYMATSCYFCSNRSIQTNWTRWHFVTWQSLKIKKVFSYRIAFNIYLQYRTFMMHKSNISILRKNQIIYNCSPLK